MNTIVRQWLDRLQACDMQGLVDLYEPHAELRSWYETWRGHEEIEDGLALARRWLRDIQVHDVQAVESKDGTTTFETLIKGKLGQARVRHQWTLCDGRIRHHQLSLLHHEAEATAS